MLKPVRLAALLALCVAFPVTAWAQAVRNGPLQLSSTTCPGTGCILLGVTGMGSASVEITGTGTFAAVIEGTIAGSAFKPVSLGASDGSGTTSTPSAAGLWSGSVAGYTQLQVRLTSYTSGLVFVTIQAAPSGGSSGGGGSGGNVSITQGGNTAQVNASSQLSVTCANCSGTGVSAAEDSAFLNGNAVTPAGSVRQDTLITDTSLDGDVTPLKSDSVGRLYTTGAGGLFPSTQSGTWTMQPGNTANTTAWLVTGTGGVFPASQSGTWNITNISGTVSLPTGAATSANQSTEITALQLIDNLPNTLGATTSGSSGALALGAVTTSAPSYTTATMNALSLSATGSLRVECTTGCAGSGGTSIADDAAFTVATTSLTPVGGTYRSTLDAVDDGDAGAFAMTARRAQHTSIRKESDGSEMGIAAASPLVVRLSDGSAFVSPASDATHGSAVITTGPGVMGEGSSDVSANTAVSDGQAVRFVADLIGRQLTLRGCDAGGRVGGVTTITDGSSTSAIAAAGSGIKLEIYDVIIANTSATAVTVDLRDGTAGSVLATFPVPANTNGVVYPFTIPITGTANTAIAVDPSASASSIITTLRGCKAK